MKKVYIVIHTRIESGSEDIFEIVNVFSDHQKATLRMNHLETSVDVESNESNGVEESYYIVEKNIVD